MILWINGKNESRVFRYIGSDGEDPVLTRVQGEENNRGESLAG